MAVDRLRGLDTDQLVAQTARRILELLLPVRLHIGTLPSEQLLRSYGLEAAYGGVLRGVRCGDVRAYRLALEQGLEAFIHAGTFLVLEKLQGLVLRALVRRCARLLDSTRLPLPVLAAVLASPALAHESFPVDVDELECLLANLVFQKKIKGYISHRPPVLVVAKKDAFPRIADLAREGAGT